jgi:hypothetical protein
MRRQEAIESSPEVPAWRRMLLALLLLVASHVATAQSGPLPARLQSYLTDAVRITGEERQRLLEALRTVRRLPGD